jgi:hypothetical protein
MMLTTDTPDQLLYDGMIPGAFTGDGCVLENVEDVPAGPWLAIVLDSIEPSRLTSWELPAYLRACARVEAWAAARKTAAVAELASRVDAVGPDKEVALALREPVGAAQTRVHFSRRLRRLLPQTWRSCVGTRATRSRAATRQVRSSDRAPRVTRLTSLCTRMRTGWLMSSYMHRWSKLH